MSVEANNVKYPVKAHKNRMGFFMPVVAFFTIACLSLIVSMGISYSRNMQMYERNVHQQSEQLAIQMKGVVDKSFEMAVQKIYDYIYDSRVQNFSLYTDFFVPDAIMAARDIIKLNQSTYITWSDVGDIIVYYPEIDILMNHEAYFYPADYYRRNALSSSGFLWESWYKALNSYSRFDFLVSSRPNADIFITSAVTGTTRDWVMATIAVKVSSQNVLSQFKAFNLTDFSDFYLLDENGNIIISSAAYISSDEYKNKDTALNFEFESMPDEKGLYYREINGVSGMLTYANSNYNGWRCVVFTPMDEIAREMSRFRVQTVVTILLFLFITTIFYLYARKQTYYPVHRLFSKIHTSLGLPDSKGNEINLMSFALDEFFKERDEFLLSVQNQMPIIQNSQLVSLINSMNHGGDLRKDLASVNIQFDFEYFALICIDIERSPGFVSDDAKKDLFIAKAIISNISRDIYRMIGCIYPVEISVNRVVMILNVENLLNSNDNLYQCSVELLNLLESTFGIIATVGLSRVEKGVENAHEIYSQAEDALSRKFISGTGTVNVYTEDEFQSERYYYPSHVEYSLINFVCVGDEANATKLVKTIFEINFKQNTQPIKYSLCLFFDITSTVLKLLSEMKIQISDIFDEGFVVEKELLDCATADEACKVICYIVREMCCYVNEHKRNKNEDLLEQIIAYIEENCSSNEICIASIADAVGITQNYLSHYFKDKTGGSAMRYVESLRIEKAKELLKDSEKTLSEISSQTGFTNSAALIRVFKKREGITPGQFRSSKL